MKKLALIVVLACLLLTSSFASEAKLQKDVEEFIPRPAKDCDVFPTPDPLVKQIDQARSKGDMKTFNDLLKELEKQLPVKEEGNHPVNVKNDNPINSPLMRWGNDIILYNGDVYYDSWTNTNDEEPLTIAQLNGDTLRAAVACPDSIIRHFLSTDNGQTWSYQGDIVFGGHMGYEPEIIFETNRYWHMLSRWSYNNGTIWSHNYDFVQDTNAGAWVDNSPDPITNYSVTSDRCDWQFAVYLYVAMHYSLGGEDDDEVWFTKSTNHGAGWLAPVLIQINGSGYPDLSFATGGYLHLSYLFHNAGNYSVNCRRSSDLGDNWFGSVTVFSDTTYKMGPQIAAAHDGSGDAWVIFPYQDVTTPNFDYGLRWSWTQDFGATWSVSGWVNSYVNDHELLPSIYVYDGYGYNGWYPYVTFIGCYYDWTNAFVYQFNWQSDSSWSTRYAYNDSLPEFVRPIQTWMDDGLPATAYVGQGGVNVYYDSWANSAVEEEKEPPVTNQLTIKTHPNPFSKTTRIQYSLPAKGNVSVHAYNILGQRVATLFDGTQESGNHYLQWNGVGNNGSRLPEGIYFLRIKTQNADKGLKLTFIR